jgi:FkbM family methyltransferase
MFISYAQNGEDVLLHRVFGQIDKGFYIDVGAMNPYYDSVTKAFYDKGWRGINIEPVPEWFEKLCAERPDDLNLNVALSSENGFLEFFEVVNSGLSTAVPEHAKAHQETGYAVTARKIESRSLSSILADYNPGEIHFLKIDVEGFELEVLRGMDFQKYRPWVCIVESTLPNSRVENWDKWESVLLHHDYTFVLFDGLNRFYVANEHSELREALSRPLARAFDVFISIYEHEKDEELARLRSENESLRNELELLQAQSRPGETPAPSLF